MAKTIALFNHKGGVSKTTTTFNLGWMLAEQGKKVIIVDTDPQCNLTGMVLGYKRGDDKDEIFYEDQTKSNIWSALSPAFESKPERINAVTCISVPNREDLFLLPGNIKFAEYEVTLGIAHQLNDTIQTLRNLPGAIAYLLKETAERYDADILLIDMNPSASSINQNILMTSDFFIIPASPDYFSVMAIDSLTNILPRWKKWAKTAVKNPTLKNAEYPFPESKTIFLGTILQKYRINRSSPSRAFKVWINKFNSIIADRLIPELNTLGMLQSSEKGKNMCLAEIPDFNSLIARSQDTQTPVFGLTDDQIQQQGTVLDNMKSSRDSFHDNFSELSKKTTKLIDQ